jgi:hypothetical protein
LTNKRNGKAIKRLKEDSDAKRDKGEKNRDDLPHHL